VRAEIGPLDLVNLTSRPNGVADSNPTRRHSRRQGQTPPHPLREPFLDARPSRVPSLPEHRTWPPFFSRIKNRSHLEVTLELRRDPDRIILQRRFAAAEIFVFRYPEARFHLSAIFVTSASAALAASAGLRSPLTTLKNILGMTKLL